LPTKSYGECAHSRPVGPSKAPKPGACCESRSLRIGPIPTSDPSAAVDCARKISSPPLHRYIMSLLAATKAIVKPVVGVVIQSGVQPKTVKVLRTTQVLHRVVPKVFFYNPDQQKSDSLGCYQRLRTDHRQCISEYVN
jgi:hypothetical protein